MLVCNISLRPRRGAIAADLAEIATAVDATATGNIVFATLVDDPASVREYVDAYSGEIMVEAASAAASVNAGLIYAVAVSEAAHVTDLWSAVTQGIVSANVTESAAATDMLTGSRLADADVVETAAATGLPDASKIAGAAFDGVLALDGPIPAMPVQPTVIYLEG